MRAVAAAGLAAALLVGSAARAQAVFTCAIGQKRVLVERAGASLVYRFGTAAKDEMSITAGASSGTVHWMQQRYAGMESQLRFTNGETSYVVYSAEGNARVGAHAISGLVVMRGTKPIADLACKRFATFDQTYDFSVLPEDTAAYSAM